MVDWQTPKWVIDPIKCYNLKEDWMMGQCPLCKYCVTNTENKKECHWCGQRLKWPLTVKEWRNAHS